MSIRVAIRSSRQSQVPFMKLTYQGPVTWHFQPMGDKHYLVVKLKDKTIAVIHDFVYVDEIEEVQELTRKYGTKSE